MTPPMRAKRTLDAAITPPRLRRTNFRSRYNADGGPALTGSWLMNRSMSLASPIAES